MMLILGTQSGYVQKVRHVGIYLLLNCRQHTVPRKTVHPLRQSKLPL